MIFFISDNKIKSMPIKELVYDPIWYSWIVSSLDIANVVGTLPNYFTIFLSLISNVFVILQECGYKIICIFYQ